MLTDTSLAPHRISEIEEADSREQRCAPCDMRAAGDPVLSAALPRARRSGCLWLLVMLAGASLSALPIHAASPTGADTVWHPSTTTSSSYTLGPQDTITVHVKDEPEILNGPYRIDLNGDLAIPEVGTIHAAGMSVDALSAAITQRCRKLLKDPVVSVSVTEYRSQRVSVLGAVGTPGVQQIQGRKTLYEVISEAGGLKQDAGGTIQVSREVGEGPLPLPGERLDASGQFEIGTVNVDALMKAQSPQANIAVRPNDVITVPEAELVYVLGAVKKPGGFALSEKETMSVMQALSLAEGPISTASTKHARILRGEGPADKRVQIAVNINKLISGKQADVMLEPNDILVIPTSSAKTAGYGAINAMVSAGTGIAIYRPY